MNPNQPNPPLITPTQSEPQVIPLDYQMPAETDAIYTGVKSAHTITRPHRFRRPVGIGLGIAAVLMVGTLVYSFWPRSTTFSYAQSTCIANPTLFPNLHGTHTSKTYKPKLETSFTIGTYPVYSGTTCIEPISSPLGAQAETIRLGSVISKRITVQPGTAPAVKTIPSADKISTRGNLSFELTSPDKIFEYRLRVGEDQFAPCDKKDRLLFCTVATMKLSQATKYDFVLERVFKGSAPAKLTQTTAVTVEPITVTASSVAPEQTIYNIPTELTLTFSKPLKNAGNAQLELLMGTARKQILTKSSVKGNVLTLKLEGPLPRSASFALTADNITASDGGFLDKPFSLSFKTSGGPKVTSTNIGSYKVQPGTNIVLTLDSAVSNIQNVREFVRLESNNAALASTITASGRTITISPQNSLGRCTKFTVKVLDGLQNEFGVVGGSAWQLNSRTICQSTFSIGTSAQGRAITAYRFGGGPSVVVYTGAIHGDEKSSTYLLNQWIDELEMNFEKIPASRSLVIIPITNPDAYAANRRTNANNVDLNRNFPANNWKSSVTMPDKSLNPTGGGTAALSEPESNALATYINDTKPRLVVSFHATGGIVTPNDAGDSVAIAKLYDSKTSAVYYTPSDIASSSVFQYDTTGAFEDWLHDKLSLPAILIELNSKTANEFASHQNSLWTTAQL